MASTVEPQWRWLAVTKDLLGLNHGMIRSVSLTSMKLHRTNISADHKTFGSRDSVLESNDGIKANTLKKSPEINSKHCLKPRHEAEHLHTTRRNNSYTSLSDVLMSRFKQFRQRLPSPLSRCSVTKVSVDAKCDSPISPDAGYESDGHANLCRPDMAVRIGIYPAQQASRDATLKDKCSQFVLVGSDCTQRVTPHKKSLERIVASNSTEKVAVPGTARKQTVEEVHQVVSDSAQRVRSCAFRKQSLEDILVISITPDVLSEILNVNPTGILLLDCRTFVSYNSNHITGALNVTCADSISRKRLTCGRACIGDMICGGEEAKKRFSDALATRNVQLMLYDDNTTDYDSLASTHPLHVVMTCLHKTGHSPLYLQGGLQAFYASYAQLCSLPAESLSITNLHDSVTPPEDEVDCNVDSAVISQILPALFVGNERDASDRDLLFRHGITHVLNVTSHIPLFFESDASVTYMRIPASDSGSQNLKQYFADAIAFIDDAVSQNGKVLVHCQAGVSRSSTIAIAYVMTRLSLRMFDAFRFVKAQRAVVAPNFNFLGQLLELEATLVSSGVVGLELPPPIGVTCSNL